MPAQWLMMYVPLLAVLIVAAAIDVRVRRIPNWLTFSLILGGAVVSFTSAGLISPSHSLAGFAMGFVLSLGLFLLGALGAGDVKLLAGVGAWIGPVGVVLVMAAAAVAGLVLVLVQCAAQRRLGILMRNTGLLVLSFASVPKLGMKHVIETGQGCRSAHRPLPYAVTVLVGLAAVMVLQVLGAGGGLP